MIRRVAAVLMLVGLAFSASPRSECVDSLRAAPSVQSAGAPAPGGCGQALNPVQCPVGFCAALPQLVTTFAAPPETRAGVDMMARAHTHTPPPPEPPPPQA